MIVTILATILTMKVGTTKNSMPRWWRLAWYSSLQDKRVAEHLSFLS